MLITITSSGIPIAVSKQTAKLRAVNNFDGGHSTTTAAVIIGTSIGLILTLLVVIFKDYISLIFADERCMPIFMVLLPGITASAIYSSYRGGLWGQKNFFAYSLCEFIEEVLLVTTAIILVSQVSGIVAGAKNAAISVSISYIASALITVCIYFYYDGKIKNPRGYYKPILNSAVPLTGIRVVSSVITSLLAIILPTRLMLSGMTSSEALSEFGIASGMTLPLLFIPGTLVGSLAMVLIPEISGNRYKNKNALSMQIEKALSFAVLVSITVLIVYLTIGKDIGKILYNNERSGELLEYAAILMIPMSLSQISSSVLNALGKEYKALKNYIFGAVTMLLSVWFLPPLIGIYSMIAGFFISFSITATLNTIIVFKNIKQTGIFIKNIFKIVLASVPCGGFCFLLNLLLKSFMPLVLSVLISSFSCIILFLFICGMLNVSNADILLKKYMLNKLTKAKK